jgi:hypothetical protein
MDVIAQKKFRQNSGLCAIMGWECFPFVADTYGAIRSDAREFIGKLLAAGEIPDGPQRPADRNRAGWSAVSTAVISRAAHQLASHRMRVLLPVPPPGGDQQTGAQAEDGMGIPHPQPSLDSLVLRSASAMPARVRRGDQRPGADAGVSEAAEGATFWTLAPNGALGLAPWPADFVQMQGPPPQVKLTAHFPGRQRAVLSARLTDLVAALHERLAREWAVDPAEFELRGAAGVWRGDVALLHYVNGDAEVQAAGRGPA